MKNKWVVGTRGSALALWQTRHVAQLLKELCPAQVETIEERVISTVGDRRLDQALHSFGGKGAFTEELEAALRNGEIDFAVHSLKDMPTKMAPDLVIGAIPKRAACEDAWVAKDDTGLMALQQGARVGTSSLRRTAQLRHLRPDLEIVPIRGNVQTRLRKMEEGLSGVILASAGLDRLGLSDQVTQRLPLEHWLPAAGQGALAIQCRADDTELLALLANIHDEKTAQAVGAERSFLGTLEGGCQVPVGAYATHQDGVLYLDALLASLDGTKLVRRQIQGAPTAYMELGKELARIVLDNGGQSIWEDVKASLEEIK